MTRLRDARSAAVQVRLADRWISRTAAATVVGLAGIAGALSYSHMRQLAQDHGQAGWHAHAFPLSVDGIEIVASLVLLADRRAGRRSGWLSWTALAAGTAGSLAANIATAHPDSVSRIIAGWPALALLIAIKLLTGLLERPSVPVAAVAAAVADQASQAVDPVPVDYWIPGTMSASPVETPAAAHPVPIRTDPAESGGPQQPSSPAADIAALDGRAAALLPAARAARDELRQDGLPLTRDALATRLRPHGHPVRNASITPLLHQLRNEQPARHAA
jgi:hypothetical protein